jgi:V/A-type H+-transporting ATPase subunit I
MTRVLVMGTMDAIRETVDYLYGTQSFHVVDFKRDEVHDIGTPLAEANEASAKLLKMMSVSSSLDVEEPSTPQKVPVDKIRRELDAALTHMELEISAEMHARKGIEDLLSQKKAMLASISPFCELDFRLDLLTHLTSVAVLSGRLRGNPEGDLKAITDAYGMFNSQDITVVLIGKEHAEPAMKALSARGFAEVKIPQLDEVPADAMGRLNREITELEAKLAEVEGRLGKLKTANSQFITAALENLTIEANKAEAPLRFGTARFTFLIDAWVPTRQMETLRKGLAGIRSGAVDMVPIAAEEGEDSPPILMDNPKAARPMQMLLEMFSLPSYNEIDPALFMFVTFPLFYGLMLGDIGYGVVILILVLSGGLTKLMNRLGMSGGAPGLNKILLYCSISSIIFGFLFDEIFGFEILGHYFSFTLFDIHFPVHRGETEMVAPMLILCVWIGIGHLMLGYIAGFRNVWVQHGLKHAILEKGGWCLILVGLTLFAFSAMPRLISGEGIQFNDPQAIAGIALLGTGVAMAFAVEGINTLLELPGLSGNLLSYTRIYAIGLSSIGIALAFNENLAMPAIESGGLGIIIGVAVLIGGHALNLALGIIGPLIQTLRLHYVEFFTKFYKGGGIKFNPLRYVRKHTKEV